MKQLNTFQKIIVMLSAVLLPAILIYTYANRISTEIIKNELIQLTLNQQDFLSEQLDIISEQLWKSAYITLSDPNALMLQHSSIAEPGYGNFKIIEALEHHLRLQSTTFSWQYELTLFSPMTGVSITTSPDRSYDLDYFRSYFSVNWSYVPLEGAAGEQYYFVRHMTKPFTLDNNPGELGLILEAAIPARNIEGMLESFAVGRTGESFFYHPDYGYIARTKAEDAVIAPLSELLQGEQFREKNGYEIIKAGGERYVMNYSASTWSGWYLVDFVPMKSVEAPLHHSLVWFYCVMGLLMLVGIAFAVIIYRSVQLPMIELIKGVRRLKRGHYDFRIPLKGQGEFHYLFDEFNRMSAETQQLIEQVYVGQLRVRDATLKQLQSQINPHFLYNNFAFIQSMTQMDNKQAVIAFTQHLSQYYRYTTRTDMASAELREELSLIASYLEIHKMQMVRLAYELKIPETMHSMVIPRLIIQPVVENAIVHGVENTLGDCLISVSGRYEGEYAVITVEDNGNGLSAEGLARLRASMSEQSSGGSGFGLWNIHQRLLLCNGGEHGLAFAHSALGGLKVELFIRPGHHPASGPMNLTGGGDS